MRTTIRLALAAAALAALIQLHAEVQITQHPTDRVVSLLGAHVTLEVTASSTALPITYIRMDRHGADRVCPTFLPPGRALSRNPPTARGPIALEGCEAAALARPESLVVGGQAPIGRTELNPEYLNRP
jgi:hypothetical protein